MVLFVEGGGDQSRLRTACRKGFTEFLRKAGLEGHMPRIVASGGRRQAYEDFCAALRQGKAAMLLVDSEAPVTLASPWTHLAARPDDNWTKPATATDEQCHLMVQCMENWFLADRDTLRVFFSQGYKESALPPANSKIETIAKNRVLAALSEATKDCKTKAGYSKGEHSFDLLARIDPARVMAASPWASRFVVTIKQAGTP